MARGALEEVSGGGLAQRNALVQQTYHDSSQRSQRAKRLRLLAILPLAAAVILVFLGLLVYKDVLLSLLGAALIVAVVIPIFALERKEEGVLGVPLHLDRGDYLAILVGLPTLVLLGMGMVINNGPLLALAFAGLVAFFLLMFWNNRRVPDRSLSAKAEDRRGETA